MLGYVCRFDQFIVWFFLLFWICLASLSCLNYCKYLGTWVICSIISARLMFNLMNRTINSIFCWSSSPRHHIYWMVIFVYLNRFLKFCQPEQQINHLLYAYMPFVKHSYMIIWCLFQFFYSIVTNTKLLVLYCSVIHFI